MKRTASGLFLALCAACSPAAPPAPSAASAPAAIADDRAAVRSDVEALLREWSLAGSEGRWNDLKELYADDPDFSWIENGAVAYDDYESVIAGVDQVAAMNASLTSRIDDIAIMPLADDAAAFRAGVSIDFSASEFSFSFNGAFTGVAVLRDGRWRFLQGHLSKPESAPT